MMSEIYGSIFNSIFTSNCPVLYLYLTKYMHFFITDFGNGVT